MRASIIIPVLNESKNIVECLKKLEPLADNNIEIIVVDGGSTDDTVSLATSIVTHSFSAKNISGERASRAIISSDAGRALQMNAGLEYAVGNYCFFLHADTGLPNDFLRQLDLIESKNLEWGFFRVRLDASNWYFRVIEILINWRSSLTSVGTGDQVLFGRKDKLIALNGFPSIPIMEDVAFSKLARSRIAKAAVVKGPVVTSARRWQQHGALKTILLMWRLRLEYFLGADPERLSKAYR